MVRHYKRKKEKTYTELTIQKALDDVRENKMTIYAAAKYYEVSRSTIRTRLHCSRDSPGHPTVFSSETESLIAESLHIMEKHGFPLTTKEAAILISEYVRRNGLTTPFKDDIPGKDWFYGFKKRNGLSIKKPQAVEISRRKACNPFVVYDYFDILEKVVEDLDLKDKPDRIYNLDETSFCEDPVKAKVIGKKGFRSTRTTSGPGRNNTTVLLATNACGDKLPPLIIFQGKFLWTQWLYPNEEVKTAYAVSQRGWMETTIFEKYLKEVFVPATNGKRPILLIFDGHSSHVDLNVIEYAVSVGITIIKLPPHSSDRLQPLDCSTMKPLKDKWESEIIKWQRLHIGSKLPKPEFARMLTKIWDELNPVIIQNGFRRTGVYPVDRNAIPKDIFDRQTMEKWLAFAQKIQIHSEEIIETDNTVAETIRNSTAAIVPSLLKLALKKVKSLEAIQEENIDPEIPNKLDFKEHNNNKNWKVTPKQKENLDSVNVLKQSPLSLKTYERKQKHQTQAINQDKCCAHQINNNYTVDNPTSFTLPIPKRLHNSESQLNPNRSQTPMKIIDVKTIVPQKKTEDNITFESLLLKTIANSIEAKVL